MSRAARLLLGLSLCVVSAGCASALHAPTEVDALLPSRGTSAPARLLAEAESAFAARTLIGARRAVDFWLRAAAAEAYRVEGTVGAARAGIWIAGHADDPGDRERASAAAVRAAQLCGRSDPEDLRCDYWLALTLGVQARERRATALDALPRIVRLLENVIAEQPDLDRAGAHRALALLYLRAPGWPTGPGDPDRGLAHARRAVALAPDYPPNQMTLAEGLAAAEDSQGSAEVYARAALLAREWRDRGDPDAAGWLERSESRSGLR